MRTAARSGYTAGMDTVRFGRALGTGAREAAKALVSAADAAAAPNPSSQREPAARPVQQQARPTTEQARQVSAGVAQGGKQFGKAVWKPVAKLSGVLWLEVTGVFFGLFLLTAGGYAVKLLLKSQSAALSAEDHRNLLLSLTVAAVFGYFCVSSFVRAGRRQRRS
ncbi:MAG TPA: hypothetical protein VGC07_08145 [Granulicella sp.]